jgi:GNAT superfamily N-acetyltransferase
METEHDTGDESAAFLIRRLSDPDLAAAIALFRDSYPERSGEAHEWLREDSVNWVASTRQRDVIIGFGRCWRVAGDRFRLDLVVDKAWRRQGVGTRLLEQLVATASAEGAATLQARGRADWTDSLAFLEHRGFRETMRMESSVLALDRVDPAVLAAAADREHQLAATGIRLSTLATESRTDAMLWTRLAELQADAQIGWRDPDPRPELLSAPATAADLRRSYQSLGVVPEALFLAVTREGDTPRYVGSAGVAPRAERPGEAWPHRTMVHPAFRGRGIATVLKGRCITWARANGYSVLYSETGNPTLQHINRRLGFRTESIEIRLVRPVA